MRLLVSLRAGENRLTKRMASWDSPWARGLLPPVEDAAEHTKLWWAAAAVMAAGGGRRGRRAAVAGIAGIGVAQVLSNGVAKQLVERRRPPKEWFAPEDVEERPDSSSFASGHTAAAVAFTAAVAPTWPSARTACAVPTVFWWPSSGSTAARTAPPTSPQEPPSGWRRPLGCGPHHACCCATSGEAPAPSAGARLVRRVSGPLIGTTGAKGDS
ncbi:phosphatase PAP2 family protein [Streptomyces sp. NPDC058434]|uniref:phosphatase PAP2 family protein n=1 Tax=Streptomyces sp. NPDC058434 TaxID=3346498 RepID=UPI00364A4E7C